MDKQRVTDTVAKEYVTPELKFLGNFSELTLGMGGSQNDGGGGGLGMACSTEVKNDFNDCGGSSG